MGKTVEFGVNVTRDIVGAKVGAIRSAAELVRTRPARELDLMSVAGSQAD